MAGTVIANALNTDSPTGTNPGAVFTNNNAYTGMAKAWVNFDGGRVNTAGTIYSAMNVSSVTYVSTGQYIINFTAPMTNANYAFAGGGEYYPSALALMCVSAYARTASALSLNNTYANSTLFNTDRVNVVVFNT
jgi:hypothetical protein